MMKIKNVLLLSIILSACNSKVDNVVLEVNHLIAELETDKEKKIFLENIFDEDQRVRDSEKAAQIVMQYGKNSKEDMDHTKRQWKQDEINLVKVEEYIKKYGYPSKELLGEYAALAPWIVIHHSTNMEVRDRNFECLYEAYLDKNIDDNQLAFYLNRSHRMRFGNDFYIESPFKPDDELNGLIAALNFEKEKEIVLNKFFN